MRTTLQAVKFSDFRMLTHSFVALSIPPTWRHHFMQAQFRMRYAILNCSVFLHYAQLTARICSLTR